jgi:hypothetical protein
MSDFDPFDSPAADGDAASAEFSAEPDFGEDEVTGADLEEDDFAAAPAGDASFDDPFGGASAESESASAPAPAASIDVGALSDDRATSFAEPTVNALDAWDVEHSRALDDKAAKENKDREAAIEAARAELDAFYADRSSSIGAKQDSNRDAEARFIADRDAALTSGEPWDRAAFFCDFQQRAEAARDTGRMRELMIGLKHE